MKNFELATTELALASTIDDARRLCALRRYDIVGTGNDATLDLLSALAARLLDVPIAMINLVDDERIWSKSHYGTDVTEYALEPGFCMTSIRVNEPTVISDASTDIRTAAHSKVTCDGGIRFYASAPLQTFDRHNIGTLCVIDFKARQLSEEQVRTLQNLAAVAMELIELRGKARCKDEISEIENRFKRTELQNQLILNSAAEGIHVIDLNGIIMVENRAAIKLLGWEEGGLIGKPSHATMHHHHADHSHYPREECPIYRTLRDGVPRNVSDEVFWRKDGTSFPVEYSTSPLNDIDGKLYGTTVVFRDITARKAAEANIQHLAYFDRLTNLPNRTLFVDRLGQDLKKAHRNDSRLALFFIDLDNFKTINDTFGHDIGDDLLVEAARRVTACLRESDTVARLGGDEFTVILNDIDDSGIEECIAKKILEVLARPFALKNEQIYLSASIGITVYPDDALTTDVLLKNADQAMYSAKKAGRNRHAYFTASMQESANARMRIITDLHSAVDHQEFFLVYQPIVELATNAVTKAEALIRWQHPTRGLISPVEFIPIAEETGLINQIGDWVFREAVSQVKRLEQIAGGKFQMSVNKSPIQFISNKECTLDWLDHLKWNGLTGENIAIEITEGLLLDASADVRASLKAKRNAGIQVSLDDFGTGYSSLAYLTKFSIDFIKIDRSFVQNLSVGSADCALCEAIIVMAHKLSIKVIAEGIETAAQRDFLVAAGCDYGQGYFFSKPLVQADFESFLERNRLGTAAATGGEFFN